MPANALIVHGGAPTAVMNASLYGVLCQARSSPEIGRVYGALGGSGGLLREALFDLSELPDSQIALLPSTPASLIGTSRDPLAREDYQRMARILQKHDIRYVFFNGGNGTMDACGKLHRALADAGLEAAVVGIPKTIDNDIAVTDHAPGFGSAARYIAQTAGEISQDIRSLPIHVCVMETMGRNAGWLAASSALARTDDGLGPDLICLPERPFDEDRFLDTVSALHRKKGGVLVVASEGLKDKKGEPVVQPIFQVGRAVYYGDVGAHLADLIIRRLGVKARSEKPGICGRASVALQSPVDRREAVLAGREAVRMALRGLSGVMVGFRRKPGERYGVRTFPIPLEQVMLTERPLPEAFIAPAGDDVTEAFLRWCRPLIGGPLRPFASLPAPGDAIG